MEKSPSLLLLCCLIVFLSTFSISHSADIIYNINNLGAKGDGKTDSTRALLGAWASACASTKSSTIYIPYGKYVISQAEFRGPCKNNKTTVRIDGTLVAPSDYRPIAKSGNWLSFVKVNGLTVNGGTLDAQGAVLWACRASGKNCPPGARSLTFNNARNIMIKGLTSINSQVTHIVINGCNNAMVRNVKIVAPNDSPNTDGIHIQSSTGVTITGASIKTGDDCISIGPGSRNLWIEKVNCGPGHGISIGSLGRYSVEEGVQNVTVKTVVFTGSDNGLRIKTWARPSSGFVSGVLYQDAIMKNVRNPIIVDQHYCPHDQGCPHQESGVKISGITYKNIRGSSATQVAMKFDCSKRNPCKDIRLQEVKLTYKNSPALSTCLYADGKASGLVSPTNCL